MKINNAKKIEEIKAAVDSGRRVFWLAAGKPLGWARRFEVIRNRKDGNHIKHHKDGHCIGLHGLEGTEYENVLNGEEHEFHFDEFWSPEPTEDAATIRKLRVSYGLAPEPPSID